MCILVNLNLPLSQPASNFEMKKTFLIINDNITYLFLYGFFHKKVTPLLNYYNIQRLKETDIQRIQRITNHKK